MDYPIPRSPHIEGIIRSCVVESLRLEAAPVGRRWVQARHVSSGTPQERGYVTLCEGEHYVCRVNGTGPFRKPSDMRLIVPCFALPTRKTAQNPPRFHRDYRGMLLMTMTGVLREDVQPSRWNLKGMARNMTGRTFTGRVVYRMKYDPQKRASRPVDYFLTI